MKRLYEKKLFVDKIYQVEHIDPAWPGENKTPMRVLNIDSKNNYVVMLSEYNGLNKETLAFILKQDWTDYSTAMNICYDYLNCLEEVIHELEILITFVNTFKESFELKLKNIETDYTFRIKCYLE